MAVNLDRIIHYRDLISGESLVRSLRKYHLEGEARLGLLLSCAEKATHRYHDLWHRWCWLLHYMWKSYWPFRLAWGRPRIHLCWSDHRCRHALPKRDGVDTANSWGTYRLP